MKRFQTLCSILLLALLTACVNHGTAFNPMAVNSITPNVTSEQQIRAMFGEPVGVRVNHKAGTRTLYYQYQNDDSLKKGMAGLGGALIGGLIGNQIGGGSGNLLATGLGASAGGLLGDNMVDARHEEQILEVVISLRSGLVIDYNYTENKGRTQAWGLNGGVGNL